MKSELVSQFNRETFASGFAYGAAWSSTLEIRDFEVKRCCRLSGTKPLGIVSHRTRSFSSSLRLAARPFDRFASSSVSVAERSRPVSGTVTWILCGSQDSLFSRGTPQARAIEREEEREESCFERRDKMYGEKPAERDRTKGTRGRSRCSCLSMFSRSGFVLRARSWKPLFRDPSIFWTRPDSSRILCVGTMIGLRATRPGVLRFLHCGRDFCRVCR